MKKGPEAESRVDTFKKKKTSDKSVSHPKHRVLLEEFKAYDSLRLTTEIIHFKASPNPN